MTEGDKKEMSKKSEKLEIRLSYEEKQELASVAETEGRTVSDLVRGLIRRYMKVTRGRLPQKTSWLKWAGIGLAGLLIGHLGTWAYTQSHRHDDPARYNLSARIGNSSLDTPILASDGYNTEIILADKEGDIKIKLNVEDRTASLSILRAEICQQKGSICENIASPILHFNPDSPASIHINDDTHKDVEMILWPPTKDAG